MTASTLSSRIVFATTDFAFFMFGKLSFLVMLVREILEYVVLICVSLV